MVTGVRNQLSYLRHVKIHQISMDSPKFLEEISRHHGTETTGKCLKFQFRRNRTNRENMRKWLYILNYHITNRNNGESTRVHVQKSELGKLALFVDHGNVLTLATNMSQQTFQTMQRNIDPRKNVFILYYIILKYILSYNIMLYHNILYFRILV